MVMGVVVLCESWRRVTENFLNQRANSQKEVFNEPSFSSALGVRLAHGTSESCFLEWWSIKEPLHLMMDESTLNSSSVSVTHWTAAVFLRFQV